MPELPEVETIVRTLAPRLEGRRILQAQFFSSRVRAGRLPVLAGRIICNVRRHGKLVLLEFDEGLLAVHLGMTGRLLLDGARGAHTRALLTLDQAALCFDDIRQFGSMRWMHGPPVKLGPDPLEISAEDFARRLRSRKARIKPLLLNQAFLRGLGNIYADEVLFRARIHPRAIAARLSETRARVLHTVMVEVLTGAIASGGSSISNYVDARGRKGSFQLLHMVYGRTGHPCPVCGTAIRRILVAQRGTHYCPRCQRA